MPADVCYYDGACGLCQRSRRVLASLDWFARLEFRDMLTEPDLPIPMEQALEGMPMRTRHGEVLVGFRAVRRTLRQTPLGFFPGWAMMLPGLSWLAERCYCWIARHRRTLGGRSACLLPTHATTQTKDGVGS
ncbi:MAG: DUF393 domain-containing protein [Planctomycetota bacterium]